MEFHWWYILIAVVVFMIFGKGKGGIVVKRFTANMQILDDRFNDCKPDADYVIFKEGKPDNLDIEIERLSIPIGDEVEFHINGKLLAKVNVKGNREAEFDHYSDEGVYFPKINEGDTLVVKYQNVDVMKGTFKLNSK